MYLSILEHLKELVAIFLLGIAAYQDLKTREIDDKIWIVILAVNGAFTAFELWFYHSLSLIYLMLYLISVAVGLAIAAVMHFGKMMGGADVKALIVLSLTETPKFRYIYGYVSIVPSLAILTNTVIISLFAPLFIFLNNARKINYLYSDLCPDESTLKKLIALFALTKVSSKEYEKNKHKYAIAERRDGSCKRIILSLFLVERDSDVQPSGEVWVSYLLPYILFIFLGYLCYVLRGALIDLIFKF
ncbi:MAG: prepilin peptidase [Thermoproteales archaeon]|nr:prepilin peptidase [Thermoproteales archaeon]